MKNIQILIAMMCGVLAAGCTSEDERLSGGEVTDVISESLIDAYYEDTDDMALTAVTSEDSPVGGGRLASDDRFCTAVSFSGTNLSGELTLDFGDGCTDPRGNTRSGVIRLTYSGGPAGSTGFTVSLTFEDYVVNGVALSGTRTLRRLASDDPKVIRHEITLENGRAVWADGSESTRSSAFVREINTVDQTVRLDGHADGVNRRGRDYSMHIDETLVYKRKCVLSEGIYMAVEGIKTFVSGGRSMIIDYGSGECDRTVTVKISGGTATTVAVTN
ncbi:MAG TPA: hypothetical protein VF191_16965 [Cyclobacteriaceae bacterium]